MRTAHQHEPVRRAMIYWEPCHDKANCATAGPGGSHRGHVVNLEQCRCRAQRRVRHDCAGASAGEWYRPGRA
jgi:hypothetical protein